ncbi:MAG: DUF4982 domain-containing protein [Planctomycetota bacterium]|nr:DUF4982 domain-containing protein [Planctomycetota bacterium]
MTWGWADEQPSWTWPGLEGRSMHIRAYSSCPRVRLTLNGRDLGVKETNRDTQFIAVWELPYEPGELVAVGLDAAGRVADRWTLSTAGPSAALRLTPDRKIIAADGQDLSFVTVEIVDKDGQMNPRAGDLVHFVVKGPGTIVGVSNADPRSIESFQQPTRGASRVSSSLTARPSADGAR